MAKLLLSDALANLDPSVLPAQQSLQIPWINACGEVFFSEGKFARTTMKWRGLNTSASFAIQYTEDFHAFFTLPRNMLCLLAGGYSQTNSQQPLQNYKVWFSRAPVQGIWHQFGNSGRGVVDERWQRGIMDLGDGFTTFADITAPSYLQIVSETSESSGANILFRGFDQNQNQIYSGSGAGNMIGVNLNFGASQTTTTTQIFGSAPYIVQKPVTNGPLNLYAINAATGASTLLATYAPSETSPGYRRYSLGGTGYIGGQPPSTPAAPPYTTVQAIIKRRFVPVAVGSDEIIPSYLGALESGLQGRRYDLQGDIATADNYWAEAFHRLNSELTEYQGGAQPQIVWQRDTGLARIPGLF